MKIKRFILSLVVAFSMLFSGIALTACDNTNNTLSEDKPIYIISVDGLADDVVLNGAYDTSKATARILFESKKVSTIENSELDFGDPIDTSEVGETTLTVSYTKYDTTVTYDKTVEVYTDSVTKFEVTFYTKSIEAGETYSFDDITAELTYRSGRTQTLSSTDLTFAPATVDTTENGVKELSVSLKADPTFNVKLDIYVYTTDIISSITKVEGLAKEVWEGTAKEDFSTKDAVASVLRTTGAVNEVTSDNLEFNFDNFNTDKAGTTVVTVSYSEGETTVHFDFEVTVKSNTVVGQEIVADSYSASINMGEEFDTSNLKLKLIFADGSEEVVDKDLSIDTSKIDTLDEGKQDFSVSATYNGETFTANGTVDVVRNYTIIGVNAPSFVSAYNKNSQTLNTYDSTDSTGVKGFTTIGKKYVVGDDNAFDFDLNVTAIKNSNTEITNRYKLDYKIYLIEYETDDESEELVEKRTLLKFDADDAHKTSTYVEIDDLNHTLQFKEEALGKTFYISVLPKYVSETEVEEYLISATTLTIEVIDGYNVYNAKQFSVLDNVNAGGKWTEFKETNSIPTNIEINAIVLHGDISITTDDIPQGHITASNGYLENWDLGYMHNAERLAGSNNTATNQDLYGAIYRRAIKEDGQFTIKGNYFTISVSTLPSFENNEDGTELGYSAVLTAEAYKQVELSNAKFYMDDLSLFGNAQKPSANEDGSVDSQIGLMFLKARNVVSYISNNLSQSWYMSYMFRGPDPEKAPSYKDENLIDEDVLVNMNGVNAYDAYNCLLYLQGAGKVSIKDSIMIGAGGPVMIVDHAIEKNPTTFKTGRPCFVEVEDCIFESYVEGAEAWFTSMAANSLAASIKSLDKVLTGLRQQIAPIYENIKDAITQAETTYNTQVDEYNKSLKDGETPKKKIDLSKYNNMLDYLDNKSILFYNSSTKTNTMLNLIAVFKSDNVADASEDSVTASTYTDLSKRPVADGLGSEPIHKIAFDQSKSANDDYKGKVVLEGLSGLAVFIKESLDGLDKFAPLPIIIGALLTGNYSSDDLTSDLTKMITALVTYEASGATSEDLKNVAVSDLSTFLQYINGQGVGINNFEALAQSLKAFNTAFNDLETYLGVHLFNNIGALLGIQSTPWYRAK